MPTSNQTQQLAQLMQALQQHQAMQQMQAQLQQSQGARPSPGMTLPGGPQAGSGSPLLQQLMGGMNPMGGPQGPPTLGVKQPIPMQMPNADPTGQQQGTPLPPNPTDMQM